MFGFQTALAGTTSQVAARLLVLMDKLGQDPTPSDLEAFPDAVKVVRATSRLAKLDFWLRNPDYLADELLNDVEAGVLDVGTGLAHAERMLTGDAPTIHLLPMQRYKYGAWELPDNAMALLKSHRFIDSHRTAEPDDDNANRARRDYFLLKDGAETLAQMRALVPQLDWYDHQADAIKQLSVGQSGAAARVRQYEQPEYASTPVGATIGPILERTRIRFDTVARANGYVPTDQPTVSRDKAQP